MDNLVSLVQLCIDKDQKLHALSLLFALIGATSQTYGYVLLKEANINQENSDKATRTYVFFKGKWLVGLALLIISEAFDYCKCTQSN